MQIGERRVWYRQNDGRPVLDGANLSLTKEKAALVGPDGAGESGLIRVVLGLALVSGGAVRADEKTSTRTGGFIEMRKRLEADAVMVVPEPNLLQRLGDRRSTS